MPSFGNKIKPLKSIFGVNNSRKSSLSEFKKREI